jgi:hypothetical protein
MKRLIMTTSLIGVLFAAAPAFSRDATGQPTMNKRQTIRDCMSRQMTANKTLTYINAAKTCSDRIKIRGDTSASNNSPSNDPGKR